ncbi:uncharacterized protein DSM5745_08740 [Aspergillus mulundensis]|uniref:Rhodopsin domain-containing protein n=1 Tax=Aspergillus mulundensis TaxID=1810919 RepID=A0A3D8R4T7_9EURO|nr:Uncharacterized protein DSM5745_08740 [Aspergillus mulundensis]RDW68980.1 Uncharacterized protein DSM5745_08740 [Aspergillus mulundensis]
MATATPFQKEAWTEYGVGVLVLLLRIFARLRVVGIKNWQGDDYFAIVALIFWTAELTMLELIGQYGTNIGLSDQERASMSPDRTARLVAGSKCLLAGWTCYVTLIWSLKTCMLFFYNRLTLGLVQQKLVKINVVLCGCTYVAVILTIFLHCRPLSKHFQVYPDPGLNCSADYINYIMIATTNVVTDAILLCIPIPLLAKVRLTIRRKLVIGVLLCGGVFVMAATLLRCILSLQDINSINNSTVWAIRETFVAIIAVNAPCIKPLFSTSVWLRSSSKDPSSNHGHYHYGKSSGAVSFGMSALGRTKHAQLESAVSRVGRDSDEFGMLREDNQRSVALASASRGDGSSFDENDADVRGGKLGTGMAKGGIQVTTMYEVRRDGRE